VIPRYNFCGEKSGTSSLAFFNFLTRNLCFIRQNSWPTFFEKFGNSIVNKQKEVGLLLSMGDLAPDFTLPSTLKKDISLSDFRGKKNVLVAFYPLDFTPG
jgi:hypothetical protein